MNFANYENAFKVSQKTSRYDIALTGLANSTNPAILVIDSANRNTDKYPEPNNYTIRFPKQYKEVTSLELLVASIPNSGYVIESGHNLFHYQETTAQVLADEYYTVELPIGNWSISEIASNLATELTDQSTLEGNNYIYTVTVNTHTNQITISQNNGSDPNAVFNMLFRGNIETCIDGSSRTLYRKGSIAKMLGFSKQDYTGSFSYTGDYAYDLVQDKYIVLDLGKNNSRTDSTNQTVQDSFCIIPLNLAVNNFQYNKDCDGIANDRYIKFFSEPIPSFEQISIKFLNSDGDLFNFNGHDHFLEFEIVSDTRRGRFIEPRP